MMLDNESPDRQFKFFKGTVTRAGPDAALFVSEITYRACVVPMEVMTAAASCTSFGTIEEHATQLANQNTDGLFRPAEFWVTALRRAAECGLILRKAEVVDRINDALSKPSRQDRISTIAIPTRNRPEMLSRLLSSVAEGLVRFDRQIEVRIVDDSDHPPLARLNRQVAVAFSQHPAMSIVYADRVARSRYAVALANESGVASEVVTFGLNGGSAACFSAGAARNCILATCAGGRLLFVDDDMLFRVCSSPSCSDHLAIGMRPEYFGTWFIRDQDRATRTDLDEDLLALHDRMLGFGRSSLATLGDGQLPNVNGCSTRLLRRIEAGDSAVLISTMRSEERRVGKEGRSRRSPDH